MLDVDVHTLLMTREQFPKQSVTGGGLACERHAPAHTEVSEAKNVELGHHDAGRLEIAVHHWVASIMVKILQKAAAVTMTTTAAFYNTRQMKQKRKRVSM